jgi:hypothetical protein
MLTKRLIKNALNAVTPMFYHSKYGGYCREEDVVIMVEKNHDERSK